MSLMWEEEMWLQTWRRVSLHTQPHSGITAVNLSFMDYMYEKLYCFCLNYIMVYPKIDSLTGIQQL